jgi:hypothetical protein
MTLYPYIATVRINTSNYTTAFTKTQVMAEDSFRALRLLETQYGKGNVIGTPQRAR